jgi:hypothetical protein
MRADGSQATCDFHRGSAVVGIHLDGGQCPSEAHVPGAVVHHFPATASQRAKPIDEPLSPGPTSRIGRRPDGPWNPRATRRRPGPPGDGQHTHDAHWALAVAGEQSQLGRRPRPTRSPLADRCRPGAPATGSQSATPRTRPPVAGTTSQLGRRPHAMRNPVSARRRPGHPGGSHSTCDAHWASAVAGEQSQLPDDDQQGREAHQGAVVAGDQLHNLDDCLSAIEARTPHAAVQESRRPANSQPMPQVDALPPGPTTP